MRIFFLILTLAVTAVGYILLQPDDTGAYTYPVIFSSVGIATIALIFTHIARKQLMPYVKLEELLELAKNGSIPAAIIFLAVAHFMTSLVGLFGGQVR